MTEDQPIVSDTVTPTVENPNPPAAKVRDPESEARHRKVQSENSDQLQEYLKMLMEKKGIKPEDLRN